MRDRVERFTNARLVLEDGIVAGALCIEEGLIAEIAPGRAFSGGFDCEGDLLLPGLVELHTDHFEKQLVPRPEVAWPPLSALMAHDAQLACAGITTVFDAVAVGDSADKPERAAMLSQALGALEAAAAQDRLRAEHWIHLRCEVAHPEMLDLFATFGRRANVRLISLMDHTPGARQYADVERFRDHVKRAHGASEEELDAFIAARRCESETYAWPHRRAIAQEARSRAVRLASHDDGTPAHIAEAAALGVSIAEFPTTLEAARAARERGMRTVMGAPNVVRGGSHSGNVAALDLAREGILDALSSDYMPVSLIEAPFRLSREAGLALPEAIALVTRNPARMAGFEDRGCIARGLRADLVRVRVIDEAPLVLGVWRGGWRVA